MVPFAEHIVRRHPWVGVAIGLAGLALMCAMAAAFSREQRNFTGRAAPEPVAFDQLDAAFDGSRWIELRGGIWQWGEALERERAIPERWVFGRIERTEVPVTDGTGRRLIVAMFDRALQPRDRAAAAFTGVVTPESERTWGGAISPDMRERPHRGRLLVFHVGAGPAEARVYVWGAVAFALCFALFTAWQWREHLRRREALDLAA